MANLSTSQSEWLELDFSFILLGMFDDIKDTKNLRLLIITSCVFPYYFQSLCTRVAVFQMQRYFRIFRTNQKNRN